MPSYLSAFLHSHSEFLLHPFKIVKPTCKSLTACSYPTFLMCSSINFTTFLNLNSYLNLVNSSIEEYKILAGVRFLYNSLIK